MSYLLCHFFDDKGTNFFKNKQKMGVENTYYTPKFYRFHNNRRFSTPFFDINMYFCGYARKLSIININKTYFNGFY